VNEKRIAGDRHQAVGKVKLAQAKRRFAETGATAVAPGESFVPDEVVQHDCFNGNGGGGRSRQAQTFNQQLDQQHLQRSAEQARKAEPPEPHRSVSSR